MKFTITKIELRKTLAVFRKVLDRKTSNDASTFLQFVGDEFEGLWVSGYRAKSALDHESIFATVCLPTVEISGVNECHIKFSVIDKLTKSAKSEITVEIVGEEVTIDNGKVRVTPKTHLESSDWIDAPAPWAKNVKNVVTRDGISAVDLAWLAKAQSDDEARPHLCGMWFGSGAVFATDGHRLHKAPLTVELTELSASGKAHRGFKGDDLLIEKAVVDLVVLVKSDEFSVTTWERKTQSQMVVTAGNWQFTADHKSDALTVPYDQVIPNYVNEHIVNEHIFRTDEWLRVLEAARDFSALLDGVVFFKSSIVCEMVDLGENEIDFTTIGTTWEGGNQKEDNSVFRARADLLLDAVSRETEITNVRWNGHLDPIVIVAGERFAVVMPQRKNPSKS